MPSAHEIRSARGRLQAAGYPLSSDETAAIERFQEVASTYRPYLAVLCQHLGIAQATLDQANRTLEDA